MEKQSVWQVVIVDWDAKQYATIDPQAEDEDWDREIGTEKEKGRDIHYFHHDVEDTSGLKHWAKQHGLTQTAASTLMSTC